MKFGSKKVHNPFNIFEFSISNKVISLEGLSNISRIVFKVCVIFSLSILEGLLASTKSFSK